MKAYLALGDKDSHGMLIARGQGEIGDALDTQLVPNCDEVVVLEELNFVGDEAGAVGFVGSVL